MAQSQLSAVEAVGFELSVQQKRLWRLGHAESCRAIGIGELGASVDRALLQAALDRVVQRYEALRTTLHPDPARRYPLQVVGHEPQITMTVTDNLLRLELPGMFADFVSLRNICDALAREYENSAGDTIVQYVDYAGWQQTLLDQDDTAEALAYWHVRERRSFATELLDSNATSFDKARESRVPDGLDRTFLLAAWFVLLWRLTGEEPVVGVEFDGRTFAELEQAVGLFARWLPMSLKLDSAMTFEEVVREVALHEEKARRWQDYFELDAQSNSTERFAAWLRRHGSRALQCGPRRASGRAMPDRSGDPNRRAESSSAAPSGCGAGQRRLSVRGCGRRASRRGQAFGRTSSVEVDRRRRTPDAAVLRAFGSTIACPYVRIG